MEQPANGSRVGFSLRSLLVVCTVVAVVSGSAASMASICRNLSGVGFVGWLVSTVASVFFLAVVAPKRKHRLPFVFRFIVAASFVFSLQFMTAMSNAGLKFDDSPTAIIFGLIAALAGLTLIKSSA